MAKSTQITRWRSVLKPSKDFSGVLYGKSSTLLEITLIAFLKRSAYPTFPKVSTLLKLEKDVRN